MIRHLLNHRRHIETARVWLKGLTGKTKKEHKLSTPKGQDNLLNIPLTHGTHTLQWRSDCLLMDGVQNHLMIEGSGYMGEGDLLDVRRVIRIDDGLKVYGSSYGKTVTILLDKEALDALVETLAAHKPHALTSLEGTAIECSWM